MKTIILLICCFLGTLTFAQTRPPSSDKSWAFELSTALRAKPKLINKTGALHPKVRNSIAFAFGLQHQRKVSKDLSFLVGLNGSAHLDFWLSETVKDVQYNESIKTNALDLTALRLNLPIGLSTPLVQHKHFNIHIKTGFITSLKVLDYGFSTSSSISLNNNEEYELSLSSSGIEHQLEWSPFLGIQLDISERLYLGFDVIYNPKYNIKGHYKFEHFTDNQLDEVGYGELETQKTCFQFGLGYKFIK
ncbi:MAG: hypothetical protein ACPGEC_00275 [Flavobacteriales bacterium]